MELIEAEYTWSTAHCKKKFPDGYFEFCLSYGSRPEYFREFDRFHWTSRHQCTRFKNRYTGPVVVDLSEWAEESPNVCLTDFLYYLLDKYGSKDCVLISEKPLGKELLAHVEKTVALDRIIQRLKPKELLSKRVIGFQVEEKEEQEHV